MRPNIVNKEEKLTENNNIVPFEKPSLRLDTITTDENWLGGLVRGTIFFSKNKNEKTYVVEKFMVYTHIGSVTELIQFAPTGQQVKYGVISLEFSRGNKLVEIETVLELVDGSEQQEGVSHEQVSEEASAGSDGGSLQPS